ncbi:pro-sigmaK processing inhibitor BofA family protein [Candidatus Micrarchaeota archaeon]|nr:pro-sigmaK processing inhibitor BofA family protein [Candidatus Micrarchaeota archaeon]
MFGFIWKLVLLVLSIAALVYALDVFGPTTLIANSLIALIALKIIGFLGIKIEINLWTLLILVFWGIPGLIVLGLLSLSGLAFRGS